MRVYNKTSKKYHRRLLRNNSTPEEKILWKHLRNRQLLNFRFLRQYSVNKYIVDFYCPEAKLGIELDGNHHFEKENKVNDLIRTYHLEKYGINVLRFKNESVRNSIYMVLGEIEKYLIHNPTPALPFDQRGPCLAGRQGWPRFIGDGGVVKKPVPYSIH